MFYFAYGSSMNFHHMRRICGWHFTMLGQACLPDFEFGLDLRGYANIHKKQGSKVFGILYKIDEQGLKALDEYEGIPLVFDRAEVDIKDGDGSLHKAWVYLEKPEEFGGKLINEPHFKMLIAGAMAGRLPEDWVNFLKSFLKNTTI
jgi:gamma-glutamylcyclotransferase (GGCT)/AIG2-like uncharacterized protein YtfP